MKHVILFLFLLLEQFAFAQPLVLTGTVEPIRDIEVSTTYDGNYWKKNSIVIKPEGPGRFRKTFDGSKPQWVWIGNEANRKWVLLSPGQPLHVTIKNDDLVFAGTARPENELIARLGLETVQNLSFIKALSAQHPYSEWPVDSVIRFRLPQVWQMLDSTRIVVRAAGVPKAIERLIQTEVTYYYANAVANNVASWLNRGHNRQAFHQYFIDTVQAHFPVPTEAELATSPAANVYLERLFALRAWKAIDVYQKDKDKAHADSAFFRTAGVHYAELEAEGRTNPNERFVFATRMRGVVPAYAWERVLNNLLYEYCMSGHLQDAARLLQFIKKNSSRPMIAAAEAMYAPLVKARDAYASNLNIRIRNDYRSIASVEALLAPYKGKVVFIDMWGTWCPYCIKDLAYAPELKKQLEGKEVVFLYIAQDKDEDDEKWRDFIFVNNLTGEHVRKRADEIGILWNALGVPDQEWAYPRYLIADQSGKIVIKDAKRPGEGDALYQQLLAVLNP